MVNGELEIISEPFVPCQSPYSGEIRCSLSKISIYFFERVFLKKAFCSFCDTITEKVEKQQSCRSNT